MKFVDNQLGHPNDKVIKPRAYGLFMIGRSCGLEIVAEISMTEMLTLKDSPLTGVLQYREDEISKEVNLGIVTNVDQREFVEVIQEPPECYFGHSNKITFSINSLFYELLCNRGSYGSRFYGAVGKLEIEVKP